jgi:hypothetical protein
MTDILIVGVVLVLVLALVVWGGSTIGSRSLRKESGYQVKKDDDV